MKPQPWSPGQETILDTNELSILLGPMAPSSPGLSRHRSRVYGGPTTGPELGLGQAEHEWHSPVSSKKCTLLLIPQGGSFSEALPEVGPKPFFGISVIKGGTDHLLPCVMHVIKPGQHGVTTSQSEG